MIKVEPRTSGDSLRRLGTNTECGDTLVWLSETRNNLGTERQRIDLALYGSVFRGLDEIAPAIQKLGYLRERMGADAVNVCRHSHYETPSDLTLTNDSQIGAKLRVCADEED